MKFLKVLVKIIFWLPLLLIALQLFYIIYSTIFGIKGGWFGWGPDSVGIDALTLSWYMVSAVGFLYLPFVIYQMLYLYIARDKLFFKLFIIEMVVILTLEFPLLYQIAANAK
ncbi:MAG: hypothetical protein WCQ49_01755 [Candidatus Saccharibacteria bacterium]